MRIRAALLACLLAPASASGTEDPAAQHDSALPAADVAVRADDPEDRLTLREAILLALRNNVDIELARTEPALAEEDVSAARGAYDPIAQGSFSFDRLQRLTANTLQASGGGPGLNLNSSDGWAYGFGFSGILPFGLQYSTTSTLNRLDSNQVVVLLDKQYSSNWDSRITMPLLRDLGMNDASVTVRRSEIARDMSEEQFRETLTGIIASVEDLYWNLAATRAQVRVATKSLKTAEDLLEQTRVQEEVGVVSRVAVTQAEAGVAEREVLLIQAENQAASAKDALLDAVLAPSADVFEDREIIPEPPRFEQRDVDMAEVIAKALRNRPEIVRAKQGIEMAEVEADFAQNQTRPRFDLIAAYGMSGLSGPSKGDPIQIRDPADPNNMITVFLPDQGKSVDSFDDYFHDEGAKSYSLGARFEVPLGNQTAESLSVQRRIDVRRARLGLKRQEQALIREVRDAVRGLRAAERAVGAAERRQAAAEESLRAEQERLRLGDSTPFTVLQFDEDLAEAEQQVIGALRSQANAITALERVQGTLLGTRGIHLEGELAR